MKIRFLTGDVNPSGKLPITYPRHVNDLVTNHHKGTDLPHVYFSMGAFRPQYEFAHGLSYASFTYENLKINKDTFNKSETINISIDLSNTSKIEGKESIQLFISNLIANNTLSVKRLRGFDKVNLKSGETKNIKFSISAEDLAFVGTDNKWVTESADFVAKTGNQTKSFFLK